MEGLELTIDYGEAPGVERAVFLGSKDFGLSVFRSVLASSPDIVWNVIHPNDSHDQRSALVEWRKEAKALRVNLITTSSKAETKRILKEYAPDIVFVCGWYQLLDAETLALPPRGFWGIHNSLLPKYRGGSPLTWSMINGDEVVGSTVFELSEEMDAGRILHQVRVKNDTHDDIATILRKIEQALLKDLPQKWSDLIGGSAELHEQNGDEATYCGQRRHYDGQIVWTQSATEIHDFVRAQSAPYPCAYTYLGDKQIKFLKTRISPKIVHGTPGQIMRLGKDGQDVVIAAGSHTALEVIKVEVDGQVQDPALVLGSINDRLTTL